jgi:two-component system, NtrC family, nitrogen regulation sensor histidine kinase NtrY
MLSKVRLFLLAISIAFISIGVYLHHSFINQFGPNQIGKLISKNVQKELDLVKSEADVLASSENNQEAWFSVSHSFVLIDHSGAVRWSRNDFVPDFSYLNEKFSVKLLQVQRGSYLLWKQSISDQQSLVAVIPLKEKWKVTNKYLRDTYNSKIIPVTDIDILPIELAKEIIVSDGLGNSLFGIAFKNTSAVYATDFWGLLTQTIGLTLFFLWLFLQLKKLHEKGKHELVFIAALLLLYALRMIMIHFKFPNGWDSFLLFSPQLFASSFLNSSLGDFFINSIAVFILCLYVFVFYYRFRATRSVIKLPASYKFLVGSASIAVAIFSFLFPFLFYEIIFHNSSIVLDITKQVSFDTVRVVAFITILLGTTSSFFFCIVFFKIANQLSDKRMPFFFIMQGTGTIIFLVYCLIENHDYTISLVLANIYFALLYLSKWHKKLLPVNFKTFAFLLITISVYSLQGALSIQKFSTEESIIAMKRFGATNLINQDVLGEYLLAESSNLISKDPFIAARFNNPLLPKGPLRHRIEKIYLNSYFDRYLSSVHLYNSSGESVDDESTSGLAASIKEFKENTVSTEYEGVFRVKDAKGSTVGKYVSITPVTKAATIVGYVVVELSLKYLIPRSVYPELLVDNRFSTFIADRDYSYILFTDSIKGNNFGEFNYDRDFDRSLISSKSIFEKGIVVSGFRHLGISTESGTTVVISIREYPLFYILVNFSFLFVLSLAVVFSWMVIYSAINLWKGKRINYSTRIQIYTYLAFVIPLIVVASTILSLIATSRESQFESEFKHRSQQIGASLQLPLADGDSLFSIRAIEERLTSLSKSFETDVNLYNERGILLATSQSAIFDNQLISNYINPKASYLLQQQKETYVIAKEKIGLLSYNSSYLALRDSNTGKVIGILNIPFFSSADEVEKSQAIILSNILVIFVAVLLLFSVASFYAVRLLVFPLRLITQTLSKTTLTTNQPLNWNSNDEIGLMVSEYNKMLYNLDQSKNQLARTQKESAWREMAQQVAHEIKNPLTPMKLTLQKMEYNLAGDIEKLKAVRLMLDQVEILNEIATSFSTFAKMPTPELIPIDLVKIIQSVAGLYSTSAQGITKFNADQQSIIVLGDEQLFNRIFSNLILNALQSGNEHMVDIRISVTTVGELVVTKIKDNGSGISNEIREKIFTPYFSSKKSGSGLGLAIVKQGVEQCGGEITFTTDSSGTEFTILFPLYIEFKSKNL